MEYGATMKQINCIRYFWSLLQADSGHICFGLECPFKMTQGPHRKIQKSPRAAKEIYYILYNICVYHKM